MAGDVMEAPAENVMTSRAAFHHLGLPQPHETKTSGGPATLKNKHTHNDRAGDNPHVAAGHGGAEVGPRRTHAAASADVHFHGAKALMLKFVHVGAAGVTGLTASTNAA